MPGGMGPVTSIMGLGNCMNFKIIEVKDVFGRVVGQGSEEARELFRHQITRVLCAKLKSLNFILKTKGSC